MVVAASPDGNHTVGTLMARDYKGIGNQDLQDGRGLVLQPIAFSGCDDGMDTQINVTPTMRVAGNAQGNLAVAVGTDLYNGAITGDVAATMSTAGSTSSKTGPTVMQPMPFGVSEKPDVGHCLRSGASKADKHESTTYVAQSMAVRRLTPVECERLQGFPDSYTDIKSKNKPTPDGPRYKALGNSMAVPVMAWIGQRIEQVEAICKQNK
jgi:DNA (cytosine-5)-methyltransferase 1